LHNELIVNGKQGFQEIGLLFW